jgi:arsenite-transporting ATPase
MAPTSAQPRTAAPRLSPGKHPARRHARPSPPTAAADAAVATVPQPSAFEDISAGVGRKYILVSGKGGVGKTSLSSSLAVRLAAQGHTTLVVSTDPAHSLGDSLAQDLSGGKPVPLQGTDLPLWAMEIDPEEAKAELKVGRCG